MQTTRLIRLSAGVRGGGRAARLFSERLQGREGPRAALEAAPSTVLRARIRNMVDRKMFHPSGWAWAAARSRLILGAMLAPTCIASGAGCDASPSQTLGSGTPACRAPAAQTVIYDGMTQGLVNALWTTGGQVFYSTSSGGLWSVPLAGGAAAQIAPDVVGVAIVGGTLYYTAEHAVGSPDSQGKQSSATALYAVPFAGGPIDPTSAVLVADNFTAGASAQDSSSLFLAGPGAGSVLKLTPPATSPATLSFDSTLGRPRPSRCHSPAPAICRSQDPTSCGSTMPAARSLRQHLRPLKRCVPGRLSAPDGLRSGHQAPDTSELRVEVPDHSNRAPIALRAVSVMCGSERLMSLTRPRSR